MTKSTITREWLQHQISAIEAVGITDSNTLTAFKLALAALDSEPVAYWRKAFRADGFCYADGINSKRYHDENPQLPLRDGDYWEVIPLYRHAQPAPEITATVERLNASGYEYEGGEVTPQNVAAVVDILLQQLDDAVQGRNAQPAPVTTSEEHRQLRDLVMMVKMLCRTIRKYNPESQQAADYTAYLQKEGLISAADCLRGSDPKETDTEDRRG